MVHFPTLSSTAYVFSGGFSRISQRGFPHSEIPGSKPICGSPGLIAAYRVLRRLLVPRHSPYTLSSLTIRNSSLRRASFLRRTRCGSFMHTARVWSEKTTVCRIFSCQRVRCCPSSARSAFRCSPPGGPPRTSKTFRTRLKLGGEYRARTGDLLVANQALSQLS